MVVQLKGNWGKLTIFNIYNEGNSNNTVKELTKFHRNNRASLEASSTESAHILWLGDFNRHHPYWDDPNHTHLFTNDTLDNMEILIEAVADVGLELILPSGTLTHKHNVMKKWTRLDQVFLSEQSHNLLILCDTQLKHHGINTDHLPIITELDLDADIAEETTMPNYRDVNWDEFSKTLSKQLDKLPAPKPLINQRQMDNACLALTGTIQEAIGLEVPIIEITPKSKCWWTKELTQLCKQVNKLNRKSYKLRANKGHKIHKTHAKATRKYNKTPKNTKQQHWHNWLKRAEDLDIWMVHRMILSPASDGGKAQIPALNHKEGKQLRTA